MQSPPGPETVIDGVRYLYFGGTSYLGLHGHPAVIEAGCAALKTYGVHTATTRAGFGTSPLLLEVERLAAQFFGTEAAFHFTSGYSANHVMLSALAPQATHVFMDESAHYCVEEACRATGLPLTRFHHLDAEDLRAKLASSLPRGGRPLVVADGVVPPTGRIAPVPDYLTILSPYAPAFLHLDDAHAFGVLGGNGRGTFDHHSLWPCANGGPPCDGVHLSVCGTLAKALGGFGGIVPGTAAFVQSARSASHYFDGASAPACPLLGCSAAALEICLAQPELRDALRENIRVLRHGLRSMGMTLTGEPTPNTGFTAGDAANMQRIHAALKNDRILLPYVPAYSAVGPEGLLRLAVCAGHTPEMRQRLLAALQHLL